MMETMTRTFSHIAVALALCLMAGTVSAQSIDVRSSTGAIVRLSVGMGVPEILKAMGPAVLKQAYETKRRESWQYGFGSVSLEEGRVIGFVQTAPAESAEAPLSPLDSSATAEKVKVSPEAEALLGEIMREIPSEPDGTDKSAGPAPNAVPLESGRINPMRDLDDEDRMRPPKK